MFIEQSYDEVYSCLKGGSGYNRGKRLAISMVEEAWLSEKEEMATLPSALQDEVVHKELGDSLVRDTTTASSLEAKQDNDNITKTRSMATPNESSSLGTTSGGGPGAKKP
ncbi:hypothetical protein Tco_0415185 [Tanacetum coccineum]